MKTLLTFALDLQEPLGVSYRDIVRSSQKLRPDSILFEALATTKRFPIYSPVTEKGFKIYLMLCWVESFRRTQWMQTTPLAPQKAMECYWNTMNSELQRSFFTF